MIRNFYVPLIFGFQVQRFVIRVFLVKKMLNVVDCDETVLVDVQLMELFPGHIGDPRGFVFPFAASTGAARTFHGLTVVAGTDLVKHPEGCDVARSAAAFERGVQVENRSGVADESGLVDATVDVRHHQAEHELCRSHVRPSWTQ
uniref:Uncharacterized protein n=1 Tax=Panagrolaimus sp. JU765 TaxID=591449 RepID=A0AC34RM03_9BILA